MIFFFFLSIPPIIQDYETKLFINFDSRVYERYLFYLRQYGLYQRMLAKSEELKNLYPSNPYPYLGIAEAYYIKGDSIQGFLALKNAYNLDSRISNQIVYLLKRLDEDGLVRFVKMAREKQKNPALFLSELVEYYLKKKEYDKVLSEIEKDLKIGGNLKKYHQELVLIAKNLGEATLKKKLSHIAPHEFESFMFDLWIERANFEKALSYAGKDKIKLRLIGNRAEEKGNYNLAAQAYRLANLFIDEARMFYKMRKPEKALELLKNLESKDALFLKAEILRIEYNDYKKALEIYERLGKEAKLEEVKLLLTTGDYSKAKKLLASLPADSESYFLKGLLFLATQEEDSLKRLAGEFLHLYPKASKTDETLYFLSLLGESPPELKTFTRGLIFFFVQDYADASKEFQKLVRSYGLADDACFFLAKSLESQERFVEAVEVYSSLQKDNPESPFAPLALYEAWVICKEKLKTEERATQLFNSLVLGYPHSIYAANARAEAK